MDKSNVIRIARKFAKAVKTKYDYKRIILFGSYAKGNNKIESDIDIAVIFKDYDDSVDMQLELMRLRRKVDTRIEPHPFKEIDFNYSDPLASEIMKNGYEIR